MTSEMGEAFNEQRKRNQDQRQKQRDAFAKKLQRHGFDYWAHSDAHYVIYTKAGPVQYWPGTARWKPQTGPSQVGWGRFLKFIEHDCPPAAS